MNNEVFRHYKGNLYLVLACPVFDPSSAGHVIAEGDRVSVFTVNNGFTLRATLGDLLNGPEVLRAIYTGAERKIEFGEILVVYVGLYDNPHGNRLCTRPLMEWHDSISFTPPGDSEPTKVLRYERVVGR